MGCSRRNAEQYVLDGKVKINGIKVLELSQKVTDRDKVTVCGKPVRKSKNTYVVFYKPAGYITTRKDDRGRKTIYDLLPEKFKDLKSAGRLDMDSSGLILLTNDGDLINIMIHPRYHIPKKYRVQIEGKFSVSDVKVFEDGVDIGEKQPARATVLEFVKDKSGQTSVILELHQGYNRQIRKMMEKMGYKVISLKRMTFGCLNLKNLKRGEFSILKKKEIDKLFEYLNKRVRDAEKVEKL
jgi:23S rRNA pseudouridine2605 synthase